MRINPVRHTKLGTRVMLGIPTTRFARRSTHWIEAMAALQMPLGSSMGRLWIEDRPIAEARNQLCEEALKRGVDYVAFISDDVLAPPNTILAMLDKIGQEYPLQDGSFGRASMISGVYWTKSVPSEPYIWRGMLKGSYRDWKVGEFFHIDMAGCDCLMIETAALKKMPRPWFSTDWVWQEGQQVPSLATEDFYFYTKAKQHDIHLFCDTGIQCAHEDRETGRMFGLEPDTPQSAGEPALGPEGEMLVADLGAGAHPIDWGRKAAVVRFDIREDMKPDVRCDLRAIPAQHAGLYDVVHARHVLEHFGRGEAMAIVRHWASLLKEGGKLMIRVPNLEWAFARFADPDCPGPLRRYAYDQLYGQQSNPWDYHQNGFTKRKLTQLLSTIPGVSEVGVVVEDEGQNLCGGATMANRSALEPEALLTMWDHAEAVHKARIKQQRMARRLVPEYETTEAQPSEAPPPNGHEMPPLLPVGPAPREEVNA